MRYNATTTTAEKMISIVLIRRDSLCTAYAEIASSKVLRKRSIKSQHEKNQNPFKGIFMSLCVRYEIYCGGYENGQTISDQRKCERENAKVFRHRWQCTGSAIGAFCLNGGRRRRVECRIFYSNDKIFWKNLDTYVHTSVPCVVCHSSTITWRKVPHIEY